MIRRKFNVEIGLDLLPPEQPARHLVHPILELLGAIDRTGSLSAAARVSDISYRHAWALIEAWEARLGHQLLDRGQGRRARLSDAGARFLWAGAQTRARFLPRLEELAARYENELQAALESPADTLEIASVWDPALSELPRVLGVDDLRVTLRFTDATDALDALNDGRCLVAGVALPLDDAQSCVRGGVLQRTLGERLRLGRHKLVRALSREQGWITRPVLDASHESDDTADAEAAAVAVVAPEAMAHAEVLAITDPTGNELSRAVEVASGRSEGALGCEPVARQLGLAFAPLRTESLMFVCLAEQLSNPAVQKLLALLRTPAWRDEVAQQPGHRAGHAGEVLSLRRTLPWYR